MNGLEYFKVAKAAASGVITPEVEAILAKNAASAFAISDTLQPSAARALVSLVVDQGSKFLSRVTRVDCKKLTVPLNVYALGTRKAVRITEGTEATPSNAADNEGKNLELKGFDLILPLYYSALEDNADNPDFEKMIEDMLAKQLENEILDLATNGTDDDYTGGAWAELNKGWITLAKAATNSRKVDTDGATDILDSLDDMLADMAGNASKFVTPSCCFILGPADAETAKELIGNVDTSAKLLTDGAPSRYRGYEILVNPFQASGTYLFCDPLDLVFGVGVHNMRRSRVDKPLARCIDLCYNMSTDYQILRDRAVCVAYSIA